MFVRSIACHLVTLCVEHMIVCFVLLISHEGYISSNPILPFFFSPGYNYSHKGYRCQDLVHLKLIVAHPITRHCASPSTSPLSDPQPLRSNPPQKVLMPTRYVCSMLAFCSPQFNSSLAAIHELQEPTSYTEAEYSECNKQYRKNWRPFFVPILGNLVSLPSSVQPIRLKQTYKAKTKFDDSVERYQAHLLAQSFSLKYGIGL